MTRRKSEPVLGAVGLAAFAALFAMLVLATLRPGAGPPPTGALEVVLGEEGCAPSTVVVPSDAEPNLVLENAGGEALVFALPSQATSVTLMPGASRELALNRYLVGEFEFFCLDEATHVALGGHPGEQLIACPIDAGVLAASAPGRGTLRIEPHDRLSEIGAAPRRS